MSGQQATATSPQSPPGCRNRSSRSGRVPAEPTAETSLVHVVELWDKVHEDEGGIEVFMAVRRAPWCEFYTEMLVLRWRSDEAGAPLRVELDDEFLCLQYFFIP